MFRNERARPKQAEFRILSPREWAEIVAVEWDSEELAVISTLFAGSGQWPLEGESPKFKERTVTRINLEFFKEDLPYRLCFKEVRTNVVPGKGGARYFHLNQQLRLCTIFRPPQKIA